MKLIQVPYDWTLESDEAKGRSEGLHFSDLQSLMLHERDPKKFALNEGEDFDQGTKGRMELGCAFEFYEKSRLRKSGIEIIDGVEFLKDGVRCTPDGETPGDRIWEFKLTWASSARDIEDWHWYYFVQIQSYAYARELLNATLIMANVCGDWKPPTAPHKRRFDLTFTPRELKENWCKVLGYKKKWERLHATRLRQAARA